MNRRSSEGVPTEGNGDAELVQDRFKGRRCHRVRGVRIFEEPEHGNVIAELLVDPLGPGSPVGDTAGTEHSEGFDHRALVFQTGQSRVRGAVKPAVDGQLKSAFELGLACHGQSNLFSLLISCVSSAASADLSFCVRVNCSAQR